MTERSDRPQLPAPPFGAPPARSPVPVTEVPAVRGKRVVLSTPQGFVYDMRAASEVTSDVEGRPSLDIVSEEDWFRWMFLGAPPHVERWAGGSVWVE